MCRFDQKMPSAIRIKRVLPNDLLKTEEKTSGSISELQLSFAEVLANGYSHDIL